MYLGCPDGLTLRGLRCSPRARNSLGLRSVPDNTQRLTDGSSGYQEREWLDADVGADP